MEAVCRRIAAGMDVVVQVAWRGAKRRVTEAIKVRGCAPRTADWNVQRLWPPEGVAVGAVGWDAADPQ